MKNKLNELRRMLEDLSPGGICEAFSGGVDSALLLTVLSELRARKPFPLLAVVFYTAFHTAEETASAETSEPSETNSAEPEATQEATSDNGNKPPVKDIIIFFAGLVLCGGFLLGSKVFSVVKAKKAAKEEDDYQDGYSN